MNTKTKLLGLFVLLCLPILCFAQSAKWVIAPNYKSITRLSDSIFVLKSEAAAEITSANGVKLAEVAADSIMPFCDGYAVALKKDKGKYMIVSILNEEFKQTPVSSGLYADDYSYFIDGLMAVKNKKGKYGSLNAEGVLVAPCKQKSPLRNGEAVSARKNNGIAINYDGPSVFAQKKQFGYKTDKVCVLPPQFVSASGFASGYAIAESTTGFGVLKLLSNSFQCKLVSAEMNAGMEDRKYTVAVLPDHKDASLKIRSKDSTGMIFENEGERKANTHSFLISSFKEKRTFTVEATDNNGTLIVWNSDYSDNNDEGTKAKTKTKTKTKNKAKRRK